MGGTYSTHSREEKYIQILCEKPQVKGPRMTLRREWEINIKMCLQEGG
jgi:hypothetical protein